MEARVHWAWPHGMVESARGQRHLLRHGVMVGGVSGAGEVGVAVNAVARHPGAGYRGVAQVDTGSPGVVIHCVVIGSTEGSGARRKLLLDSHVADVNVGGGSGVRPHL